MEDFLFVYGTLRGEFENFHARMLRAQAELTGVATVRGSVFRISHYPGYRPQPDGTVVGELYRLKNPQQTLAALDAWEGGKYIRLRTEISTAAGAGVAAWIYQYKTQPPAAHRIGSGDFCQP